MITFIEPTTNQVMAVYSGESGSPYWEAQGYQRVEIPDEHAQGVRRYGRNGKLALDADSNVTGVSAATNPAQPVESKREPTAAAAAMTKADPSVADLVAYIKERDGLN